MNMDWNHAWSSPSVTGELKQSPQDFLVEEVLGFEPEGTGEHLFLWVEKVGMNTEYLARLLAKMASIAPAKVTYSGVKDRHACTRQWFCLHVLNSTPDFSGLEAHLRPDEQVRILRSVRHPRKLRVGTHKSNQFVLRIRSLQGDLSELEDRLALVKLEGVPNYFGPQRFGIQGNNLQQGAAWLADGRQKKSRLSKTESFWLSAIRSWFFNQALSDQIEDGRWNRVFVGDRVQLQGTQSQFRVEQLDAALYRRLHQLDLHPMLPLVSPTWEGNVSTDRAAAMVRSWQLHGDTLTQLLALSLSSDMRATRLVPEDLAWELLEDQLILQFRLPKGCFATSVVRELIALNDVSQKENHANSDCE